MRHLLTTAAAALAAVLVLTPATALAGETLKFDVAENASRFVFDEAPVFDDGQPAYGNSFVTQGFIYPSGTLGHANGVLPDGSPEFPEKMIGTWICRGWFIGDGARTTSGPWVVTTQYYDFDDYPGHKSLVSEGLELADVNKPIRRAITGGTGAYRNASGQARQVLLGFNASEGVNLRFEVQVDRDHGTTKAEELLRRLFNRPSRHEAQAWTE